ncbi:hypothetical protein NDU88_005009 [Pleurodeles waltl]|uniref:Uncharacterized protein n=1 Tax=Pleurodeles waltl TaxID=8319 RepID=A0AAV7W9W4_PLEWA|nr:hypothetical protein NDU88_005009 [Pleurodeles waltl]
MSLPTWRGERRGAHRKPRASRIKHALCSAAGVPAHTPSCGNLTAATQTGAEEWPGSCEYDKNGLWNRDREPGTAVT